MDMKVDPSYIRAQRERRAWSQEHLAEVAGLGLRTIQRIEKTGNASYESARSLASVFELDVAELRVAPPAAAAPAAVRTNLALRPVLGVLGALVAGGALLATTSSFAADKVLMDLSLALDSADEPRALATQVVVDEGTLVPDVNDLRLGDLRFSIVPRVQSPDRILLEVSIYERRGDEEVIVSQPQLITLNGDTAEVVVADDGRTLRLAVTAQLNPPELPPALRGGRPE
jgi:transcriptional regulator with XRE-family HTH domain